MDTLREENSPPNIESQTMNFLAMEQNHHRLAVDNDRQSSLPTSRRPSAILAALRRPSQAFALSAVQAFMSQRRNMAGLLNNHGNHPSTNDYEKEDIILNKEQGNDAVTTILSAFYAKLLVVLGMAFPITEILSKEVTTSFYQGFYLYLYVGSISFLIVIYTTVAKEKAVNSLLNSFQNNANMESNSVRISSNQSKRYGSFYLRLGAIAFGIGSMVYSGLEFVRYFEAKHYAKCDTNVLHAITPAARTLLTLLQMQFIFLSSKDLELRKIKNVARFGLMHMIATDLCEWLYVLVEETKHEMIHLAEQYNDTETLIHEKFCQEELVTGSLVMNSSPFLFPCTIEYSLICAVILFEMWKKMRTFTPRKSVRTSEKKSNTQKEQNTYLFNNLGGSPVNSENHITVDCSSAHKGLFAGIMVIVFTIISLIMFFVLTQDHTNSMEAKRRHILAQVEVNSVELVLYVITILATIVAMVRMRAMKYERKLKAEGQAGIGLDNTLLVVAQTGVFIYSMFSIIGNCFTSKGSITISLLAEIFSFLQTSLQTIFVLDSWWRRCSDTEQSLEKPGRELITFLIISNMALWTINSLEKNKAEFNPDQIAFFGDWAWTIITHISMPLAIFYRFHSTICLFEIWKNAYKLKSNINAPVITIN
ncbi:proton channel OtopLc isoform X2 [Coccinella septempunctata]|uniref:proton channel OtopLc isoform X2 n=1 Tax=Coccinella septempunctata TaxID=41139 RepID=UPI001D077C11|nr:proton channel OtopLc isoform X2 [Coccinella septempunctata]